MATSKKVPLFPNDTDSIHQDPEGENGMERRDRIRSQKGEILALNGTQES